MGPYKKGDVLGHTGNIVQGVLGVGGCAVVYLVEGKGNRLYAWKTFRDEYLADGEIRKRFSREANIWVSLGKHPFIVQAHMAEEIDGRPFIAMEYIAPTERGLNSLDAYLSRQAPNLRQGLRWSIQLCYAMEHAYTHGLRCHRDIKPANVMITSDGTVKITDFGIAAVLTSLDALEATTSILIGSSDSTVIGAGFGTPTHMPPEQFRNAAECDERSDVYAFGIVLYEIATGGDLPFRVPRRDARRFWTEMHEIQQTFSTPKIASPLYPIIKRCLQKDPKDRYQSFGAVRKELELLLLHHSGETIRVTPTAGSESEDLVRRALGLLSIGKPADALRTYEQALELDPEKTDLCLINMGVCLQHLGRFEEAIEYYNRALLINPSNKHALVDKAGTLRSLKFYDDALRYCREALRVDPDYHFAWSEQGHVLMEIGQNEQAIASFDRAIAISPRDLDDWGWKGDCLLNIGRLDEAIYCYDKVINTDPLRPAIWCNKGTCFSRLELNDDAIACYDKALSISPGYVIAWLNKASTLKGIGNLESALSCYDRALEIDPASANAWFNKATTLHSLRRFDAVVECYDRFLEIYSDSDAVAWYNKGLAEEALGRKQDAARSFQNAINFAPSDGEEYVEEARRKVYSLLSAATSDFH